MHILRSNHLIGIYTRFICIGNDMRFLVLPCAVKPAPAASQRSWILMLQFVLGICLPLPIWIFLSLSLVLPLSFQNQKWQFQKQPMQRSVKLTSKSWMDLCVCAYSVQSWNWIFIASGSCRPPFLFQCEGLVCVECNRNVFIVFVPLMTVPKLMTLSQAHTHMRYRLFSNMKAVA